MLKRQRAKASRLTPKIIGFLAPKRSKILPLNGAKQAPIIAPGKTKRPATVELE